MALPVCPGRRRHRDDVMRKQAQAELIASAVRATQWRKHANPKQAVQAFPGT